MQKIFLAGNVSSVKEVRDVGQNKVFSFSVAVSNGKDKNTGDYKPSSFYDCNVWGIRGEALSRIISKGTKVAVSGRLQPARVHEGKAYQSVDADEVTLQGGGSDAGHQQERSPPQNSGYGSGGSAMSDEIPFSPCM